MNNLNNHTFLRLFRKKVGLAGDYADFVFFICENCRKKEFLKYNCNISITQLTNCNGILQRVKNK